MPSHVSTEYGPLSVCVPLRFQASSSRQRSSSVVDARTDFRTASDAAIGRS
jgi:hypothetical protein